jgi:hypothetical protein
MKCLKKAGAELFQFHQQNSKGKMKILNLFFPNDLDGAALCGLVQDDHHGGTLGVPEMTSRMALMGLPCGGCPTMAQSQPPVSHRSCFASTWVELLRKTGEALADRVHCPECDVLPALG